MILDLLEIGIVASIVVYLSLWRIRIHRHRKAAWDTLVTQLKLSNHNLELGSGPLWNNNLWCAPRVSGRRIQNATGLWEMYENAGIMLKMVDYAVFDGVAVDAELLERLRSDATQIRIRAFYALSGHACSQVTEETRVNLARMTAIYSDMVSRMSLIQVNDGMLNHGFAGSL